MVVIRAFAAVALIGAATPAAADGVAIPVKGFLCDTAAHAVAFADETSSGVLAEIAKDRVGKAAGAEVCGLYRGVATVQTEEVKLVGGVAYRVSSLRFARDGRVAWLAERTFAPVEAQDTAL